MPPSVSALATRTMVVPSTSPRVAATRTAIVRWKLPKVVMMSDRGQAKIRRALALGPSPTARLSGNREGYPRTRSALELLRNSWEIGPAREGCGSLNAVFVERQLGRAKFLR